MHKLKATLLALPQCYIRANNRNDIEIVAINTLRKNFVEVRRYCIEQKKEKLLQILHLGLSDFLCGRN